ncbi:Disease resistance protein [Camellia lanceoleosa]|uniref:Disease resistance protein n=1 Tax=Camellia lanceoleosa TaxID=1840588 RepID=A0ACC0IRX3_9ERIC|nr:Disease resistance protein [Camellia lanceoleosa]
MKKKVVLQVDINDGKARSKALKLVIGVAGVDSVAVDMKEKKLTMTGDVDPVVVLSKLREFYPADILSVGPVTGPVKEPQKKDKSKKDEPVYSYETVEDVMGITTVFQEPQKKDKSKKDEPAYSYETVEEGMGITTVFQEPQKKDKSKKDEPVNSYETVEEGMGITTVFQFMKGLWKKKKNDSNKDEPKKADEKEREKTTGRKETRQIAEDWMKEPEKKVSFVPTHDPNKLQIQSSTCSSTLRAAPDPNKDEPNKTDEKGKEKPKEWEEMRQKAEVLIRKKDFILQLVLSYPMKLEGRANKENFVEQLEFPFASMKQDMRRLQALLSNKNIYDKHKSEISEKIKIEMGDLLFNVERSLAIYDFHVVAYLPKEADTISPHESLWWRIEVGLTRQTSGCTFEVPDEMLTLAIDSAICQVSKCFEDGIFRKIGISGCEGEKVAKAFIDRPTNRAKFSVVLCVCVSQNHSTEEVWQNIAKQIHGLEETDDIFKDPLAFNYKLLPKEFLLLVDCVDGQADLHDLRIPDHGFVVLTTPSQDVYEIMELDLVVRMEDHLLPWELFCRNVGPVVVNSCAVIQQMAIRLVKECHYHLLAIILLARALKDATDIGAWKLAVHELTSQSSCEQAEGMSEAMVHVLKLIWIQKDITTKHCIKNCTHQQQWMTNSLVPDWIQNGLIETEAEGKVILEELIDSFLLENVGKSYVQMRDETKMVLQEYFIPSLLLRQGGLGLTEAPKVEEWVNAMEIELMNNKISELPQNPKCSFLQKLLLHNNHDLMEIPESFFEVMPLLKILDLSYTSIKSLPPSISRLVSLRTFYLRGCELLRELPSQIGALGNLEEFDLEGTRIIYLPKEIGKLVNLTCFKVSFCGRANRYRKTKQIETTIPIGVLSNLCRLNELSIDVNPDGEWWDVDVKAIFNELSSSKELRILELYLPSVELLQQIRRWDNTNLHQFTFTVGRHRQRIISRLPHEVEEISKKWKKHNNCLEYINGEDMPFEITEALNHATFFILQRHWTVKMLSEFRSEMLKLKICLLVECNELQTIIDGNYEHQSGVNEEPIFKCLEYLGIHYMRNLESICRSSIDEACLTNLISLSLHTCPNLTTIFTPYLLGNLNNLKDLIVEDCCKIKSLVCQEFSDLKFGYAFLRLERMSLLNLPELVSISGGLSIGPVMESLVIYNCSKLEILYATEVSSNNLKIKGEKDWWDKLKWHESNTLPAYEELHEDSMDQLTKDIYSHNCGCFSNSKVMTVS